jgi:hypothetical protein
MLIYIISILLIRTIANLGIQRANIYLKQTLTPAQTTELQALGITVYFSSWIPPTDNNPDGFYIADMPVNTLNAVESKDYIARLDTTETKLNLQSSIISRYNAMEEKADEVKIL